MPKRFTDTDKWKKPILKSMPAAYKLLWLYICDDCNHAGIWHVDIDVAGLRVGETLDLKKAIEVFKDRIVVFDGGEKWFIPGFIEFQYGKLNEKNKVHFSVLKELNKYGLLENKEHTSPLQGAKEKDKEKEMDKEEDKEEKGVQGEKQDQPEILWTDVVKKFNNDFHWKEKFCRDKNIRPPDLEAKMGEFITDIELKEDFKPLKDLKNHFTNWFNLKNKDGTKQTGTARQNGQAAVRAALREKGNAAFAAATRAQDY